MPVGVDFRQNVWRQKNSFVRNGRSC